MARNGRRLTYYGKFLDDWRKKLETPKTRFQRVLGSAMGSRNKTNEIQGVDGSRIKNFPFSSLRLLGFLQIGIGVTCLVLGITDLFLYLYVDPDYNSDTLSSLTIACLPVWCGLWFLVAGAMGTCMSLEQKTTLAYFKNTYMILSILCALLFGPALLGIEIYIVVLRSDKGEKVYEWIFPLILAFFAVNEIICAIITASICCCCSPIQQAKVRVLYQRDLEDYRRPSEYKPRLSTPEIFYTKQSRDAYEHERGRRPTMHYDYDSEDDEGFGSARRPSERAYDEDRRKSRVYDDDRRKPRVHTYSERRKSHVHDDDRRKPPREPPREPHREHPRDHPDDRRRPRGDEANDRARSPDDIEDDVEYPGGRAPRVSMTAESPDMSRTRPETYDSQYRRLKRFALPGNPDSF